MTDRSATRQKRIKHRMRNSNASKRREYDTSSEDRGRLSLQLQVRRLCALLPHWRHRLLRSVFVANWTLRTQVFVGGHLTISASLFPAQLSAPSVCRLAHAPGTIIYLPTGIELKEKKDCCRSQPFLRQFLNKLQSFQVKLGIESLPASPVWWLN